MQPTTPFKTQSWILHASELLAWLATAALFFWNRWDLLSSLSKTVLIVSWFAYILIRVCSLWRWHRTAARGEGLERHFTQLGVAAIYGALVASLAALSNILSFLIFPVAIVLSIVCAINMTLLYLWCKDKSHVPVNYYSHRKFTQEDA